MGTNSTAGASNIHIGGFTHECRPPVLTGGTDAREQERKDIGLELQQWISKPHCTSSPYKFVARVMDAIALLHLGRALKGE